MVTKINISYECYDVLRETFAVICADCIDDKKRAKNGS
jgi:hypothetical protein